MLGPLPLRHRIILVLSALSLGLVAGFVIAARSGPASSGLSLGLGLGTLVAFLAVVDLKAPSARPLRVRSRR